MREWVQFKAVKRNLCLALVLFQVSSHSELHLIPTEKSVLKQKKVCNTRFFTQKALNSLYILLEVGRKRVKKTGYPQFLDSLFFLQAFPKVFFSYDYGNLYVFFIIKH